MHLNPHNGEVEGRRVDILRTQGFPSSWYVWIGLLRRTGGDVVKTCCTHGDTTIPSCDVGSGCGWSGDLDRGRCCIRHAANVSLTEDGCARTRQPLELVP